MALSAARGVNLSLNELEALCRKAARGAGLDWGPADEAGRAARRLAAFDLPGPELLLARLARHAGDGVPAGALSPRSLDGEWWSAGEVLCPVLAGAALSDAAWRLGDAGEIVLHDVICPLLLTPFVGLAARQLGTPVSVAWADLILTDDGCVLWLDGTRARIFDERADTVRCVTGAALDTPSGKPLSQVTRARPDPVCVEGLEAFAQRTYAPATEESRLRGAGSALTEDG